MIRRAHAASGPSMKTRLLTIVWLMLVWFAVWGAITPVLALTGFLVGIFAVLVFPLPSVEFRFGFHPLRALALLGRFGWDVAVASVQVAWLAVRPAPPRSAVITVQLTTRSDLVQTLTAIAVSLVPGSLIIDADPDARSLTIHVLDSPPSELDDVRRTVLAQEARIQSAIGGPAPQPHVPHERRTR